MYIHELNTPTPRTPAFLLTPETRRVLELVQAHTGTTGNPPTIAEAAATAEQRLLEIATDRNTATDELFIVGFSRERIEETLPKWSAKARAAVTQFVQSAEDHLERGEPPSFTLTIPPTTPLDLTLPLGLGNYDCAAAAQRIIALDAEQFLIELWMLAVKRQTQEHDDSGMSANLHENILLAAEAFVWVRPALARARFEVPDDTDPEGRRNSITGKAPAGFDRSMDLGERLGNRLTARADAGLDLAGRVLAAARKF